MTGTNGAGALRKRREKSLRRRGVSLVELTVVLSISAVIMSTIGVTMQLLYRNIDDRRKEQHLSGTVLRLAEQFRRDCRNASSHEVGEEGSSLQLSFENGTLATYVAEGSTIRLTVDSAGDRIRSETYRLEKSQRAGFSIAEQATADFVELRITQEKQGKSNVKYAIRATFGADRRFERSAP